MQINLTQNSTNFGLKFTERAKDVIQNSIKEEKSNFSAQRLSSLYSSMQKDEFNNCTLDVNEKGQITFTMPLSDQIGSTYKNKFNQTRVFYESLYDAYLNLAKRVHDYKNV